MGAIRTKMFQDDDSDDEDMSARAAEAMARLRRRKRESLSFTYACDCGLHTSATKSLVVYFVVDAKRSGDGGARGKCLIGVVCMNA